MEQICSEKNGQLIVSSNRINGGQIAYADFLYQIVGTLALRTWTRECNDPDPTATESDSDMEALLDFVNDGQLYHEIDDKDAVIASLATDVPVGTRVLLQFKFSNPRHPAPLTPRDLAEICKSFARTFTRATIYADWRLVALVAQAGDHSATPSSSRQPPAGQPPVAGGWPANTSAARSGSAQLTPIAYASLTSLTLLGAGRDLDAFQAPQCCIGEPGGHINELSPPLPPIQARIRHLVISSSRHLDMMWQATDHASSVTTTRQSSSKPT